MLTLIYRQNHNRFHYWNHTGQLCQWNYFKSFLSGVVYIWLSLLWMSTWLTWTCIHSFDGRQYHVFGCDRVSVVTFSSVNRVLRHVDYISSVADNNHKCALLEEVMPSIPFKTGSTYTYGAMREAQVRNHTIHSVHQFYSPKTTRYCITATLLGFNIN